MSTSSTAYELLTKTVFAELAKLEGWKTLELTHNKILTSPTGADHQIDVYIRYELLGREQEIVIECKNFQKPVDKPRLMTFVGVIADLKRVQGLLVTRKGFDKGNIEPIAKAHNIGLYTLDETDEFAPMAFSATLVEHMARIIVVQVESGADTKQLLDLSHVEPDDWLVSDENGQVVASFEDLMAQAYDQMILLNVPVDHTLTLDFGTGGMFLQARNITMNKVRLFGVVFQRHEKLHGTKHIDVRLTHLLQVVTSDKRFVVNQEGKIYQMGEQISLPVVFESAGPMGKDITVNIITQIEK